VLDENTCCIDILSLFRKYTLILRRSGSSRCLALLSNGRSRVIPCHPRALGIYWLYLLSWKRTWFKLNKDWTEACRAVMLIVTPSVSNKDRCLEPFLFMLNTCLSLSWLDPSVWPRSQVARLRPETGLFECASEGSHCKLLVFKGRYLEVLIVLVAWCPLECGTDPARDFWVVPKVIDGCL
jgi:hypothetical protein